MKAVILAGGSGTRGRPYTYHTPKAMFPVEGRPLIDHIVRYVSGFGFVTEIIVLSDLQGLGGQIRNYYADYHRARISFVQDSQSGTAGDLLHVEDRLGNDAGFLLWFADNLCAINLDRMQRRFKSGREIACVAVRGSRREQTGFAEVRDGTITKFMEKPLTRLQNPECLGIYMLDRQVMRLIRDKKRKSVNLSYDILQDMSAKGMVGAFDVGDADWMDAESPAVLERNRDTVHAIIRQMERRNGPQTP